MHERYNRRIAARAGKRQRVAVPGRQQSGPAVVSVPVRSQDIRSAINALQLLCTGTEGAAVGGREAR